RYAGLGEALAAAENGVISPEAKAAFEQAVKLDGENVRARYYLGVAAEQAGHPSEAAALWRAMIARAPAGVPWADFIRSEIARGEGGPGEGEVAAAGELNPGPRTVLSRRMAGRVARGRGRGGRRLGGGRRLRRCHVA